MGLNRKKNIKAQTIFRDWIMSKEQDKKNGTKYHAGVGGGYIFCKVFIAGDFDMR
ncbi:MAG: hypothetical protein ABIQ31_11405 [Ferruginibacter sp.]